MINKIKNSNGFSLIEILASIVLLTVVISLFLSVFPQMANMNNRNSGNLDAANIAKELLVEIKKIKFNEASIGTNLPFAVTSVNRSKDGKKKVVFGDYKSFKVRLSVTETVEETDVPLHRLKIEIFKKEQDVLIETNVLSTTHGYIKN